MEPSRPQVRCNLGYPGGRASPVRTALSQTLCLTCISAALGAELSGLRIQSLDLVGLQDRSRKRVRTGRVDLLGRLDASLGHGLLNNFQTCFEALHISTIL